MANQYVAGQAVTIFVEDHHTFKRGDVAKVHPKHKPENDYVMVCDPNTPEEFWVFELEQLIEPSPSAIAKIMDERFRQAVIKIGRKKLVVNNTNKDKILEDLQQQIIDATVAIGLIRTAFE